jgi:hypothetical protein
MKYKINQIPDKDKNNRVDDVIEECPARCRFLYISRLRNRE